MAVVGAGVAAVFAAATASFATAALTTAVSVLFLLVLQFCCYSCGIGIRFLLVRYSYFGIFNR